MGRKTIAAMAVAAVGLPLAAAVVVTANKVPQSQTSVAVERSSAAAVSAPLGDGDAVRLAEQASFGPTPTLVSTITGQGLDAWLTAQFASTTSSYVDLESRAVPRDFCLAKTGADLFNCNRDHFSQVPVAMRFYADAVQNDDQLRQRVAYALSQIVVASDQSVASTAGLATLNQIFLDNAFGNYRDILQGVTLNPYMGSYLNMADSSKAAPSENYARELMQLFSMGVNEVSANGTSVTDAQGAAVPNYTSADVHDIARALTGWTYARLNGQPLTNSLALDYAHPMVMTPGNYDSAAKSFLGHSVAAGTSQAASVAAVVDAVFNKPSTGVYISKQLIQQLVKSNPSRAYVARISGVFANNGAGVRGDLKAVVRAILTDVEARGDVDASAGSGKVKEPTLLLTNLFRAIGGASDGYAFTTRDAALGQQPFRSPSVFNFYPPDYPLPQGGGLVSPPSKLITTSTVLNRQNFVYDWTVAGENTRGEFQVQAAIAGATGTALDWTSWNTLGADTNGLLNRVNQLFFNGAMTSAQRAALQTAVIAIVNKTPATQAHLRAQAALYIAASSPQYQVAR